jgi:hypothetical protein
MITKEEAREKCIALWAEIARRVVEPEFQNFAQVESDDGAYVGMNIKRDALRSLFPDDCPESLCYLCEYFEHSVTHRCWRGLYGEKDDFCPLRTVEGCSLYHYFCHHCSVGEWEEARMNALMIVRQVEAWT